MTEKQFADLIRRHVIMDSNTYADNMARVVAAGFTLNILCVHLNDEYALEEYEVPYELINIDQKGNSLQKAVVFNAVDFRVELTYKDARSIIVLQPSQYTIIEAKDIPDFMEYQKAGLIKVFKGYLSGRYFTDEFSLAFA